VSHADHLLPVTLARLASLPSGVQVCNADGDFLGRSLVDGAGHVYLSEEPDRLLTAAYLDLRDRLTRATVAALVVRPHLTQIDRYVWVYDRTPLGIVFASMGMLDMSHDEIATLARLARAAWGIA